MAGELRCKAIRYKTALPLIRGGSATAGPMCAERCPRDYVCEPVVPNFKAQAIPMPRGIPSSTLMTEMEMSSRRPMATAILPDMSTMD